MAERLTAGSAVVLVSWLAGHQRASAANIQPLTAHAASCLACNRETVEDTGDIREQGLGARMAGSVLGMMVNRDTGKQDGK